jgi:hypothetical protein
MALTGIGAAPESGRVSSNNDTKGINWDVNLIPTYSLEAVTLGLDLAMRLENMLVKDEYGKTWKDHECDRSWSPVQLKLGVGGFAQMGFGSGSLKAGVAYKFPTLDTVLKNSRTPGKYYESNHDGGKLKRGFVGHGELSIPIILEYAFF